MQKTKEQNTSQKIKKKVEIEMYWENKKMY